jgi:hypothetical protein
MLMSVQCGGCVTEGVTEPNHTDGITWVGAISPDESVRAVGFTLDAKGIVVGFDH